MPPNILWIVLEDVSPRIGCYGDPLAETPHIDALAAEGRRYDRMFSTTGVCAPSRASLVTGMMPQSIGAQHMRTSTHDVDGLVESYECVPPHYVTAVSEFLRKDGYYCTLDVKTDFQFGSPLTMWDRHATGAGWWDDARDSGQPFFAMMTNGVTHESGMWEPTTDGPTPEGGVIGEPKTDPEAVTVPPFLADSEETRVAIARQYDNIARMDAWVGSLLDRLAKDGYADETVVILVGDHGEGLPRKKRWPYDGGTHVPLVVRGPGIADGTASERLVSGVDIAPTTLTLAGISPPQYVDGRSFLDSAVEERSFVVSTRDRVDESYDMVRSIRDDRFRYVRHYYPEKPYIQHVPYRDRHPAMKALYRRHAHGSLSDEEAEWFAPNRAAEELFDLDADPDEMENLASNPEYGDVLDRLRSALDRWRIECGDDRCGDEAEFEMRRRMWPSGNQPSTSAPRFVIRGPEGTEDRVSTGESIDGPATIALYCPTQGASLTWSMERDTPWEIYDGPKRVRPGWEGVVRAKAVRYGYAPSDPVERVFRVE